MEYKKRIVYRVSSIAYKISDYFSAIHYTRYSIRPVSSRGFTLLETMLYIVVAVAVLYVAAMLYSVIIDNDARNDARTSVDESSAHALRIMTDAIRRAQSVEVPEHQSTDASLTLHMTDLSLEPTNISLSDGVIVIHEGSQDPVEITSPEAQVSSLSFENISNNSASDSIHIQLVAEHGNPDVPQTWYTHTYYASATTR